MSTDSMTRFRAAHKNGTAVDSLYFYIKEEEMDNLLFLLFISFLLLIESAKHLGTAGLLTQAE